MKVGIIGLPESGATTLFNVLTGAHGTVGPAHRAGARQVGIVRVPDERVEFLAEMFSPKKVTHATIEVEDCGGVFEHVGRPEEGGGAHAIAGTRALDGLVVVLRAFPDPAVAHPLGSVDPARDYARIEEELLLADLAVVENRIENIDRALGRPIPAADRDRLQEELDLLGRCREAVERQFGIRSVKMTAAQERLVRSYSFLTLKPGVHVLNVGEEAAGQGAAVPGIDGPLVPICAQIEMEIMGLEEADRAEFLSDGGLREPAAGRVVQECYRALGLCTFLTYGSDEVRAWSIRAGATAVEAAGEVHTDIARGFIRAEVVAFEDLKACGSIREAKAQGKWRLEGKDYVVQDGDVVTVRHSG